MSLDEPKLLQGSDEDPEEEHIAGLTFSASEWDKNNGVLISF